MTPEQFKDIMREMEEEYEYFMSIGDEMAAKAILYEMNRLEAEYGRGG